MRYNNHYQKPDRRNLDINPLHPASRGILMYWTFTEGAGNPTSKGRLRYTLRMNTGNAPVTWGQGPSGMGVSGNLVTIDQDTTTLVGGSPWSLALFGNRGISNNNLYLGKNVNGASISVGGQSFNVPFSIAGCNKNIRLPSNTSIDYAVVGTYDGTQASAGINVYVNGWQGLTSSTQEGSGTANHNAESITVGNNAGVITYLAIIWDRVLTPAEAIDFTVNPWDMFIPSRYNWRSYQISNYVNFRPSPVDTIIVNEGLGNGLDVLVDNTRNINIFDSITVDDSFNPVIPDPIVSVFDTVTIDDTNSDYGNPRVIIPYFYPYPTPVAYPTVNINHNQRKKPTRGSTLDRNNIITKGMNGVYLFNEGSFGVIKDYSGFGFDFDTMKDPIGRWIGSTYGMAFEPGGSNKTLKNTNVDGTRTPFYNGSPISWFAIYNPYSASSNGIIVRTVNTSLVSSSQLSMVIDTTGTDLTVQTPANTLSGRTFHRIGGTWNGKTTLLSSDIKLFVNSSLVPNQTTSNGTGSIVDNTSVAPNLLGNTHDSAIVCLYVWNRELTVNEMLSIHQDPWQIFEQSNQTKFYSYYNGANAIRVGEDITVSENVNMFLLSINISDNISVTDAPTVGNPSIIPTELRTTRTQFVHNITKPKDIYALNYDNVVTRGIVAAFPMNEAGGIQLVDYSGNGFHVKSTVPSVGRWIASPQGPAYQLGTNEGLNTDTSKFVGNRVFPNNQPFTLFFRGLANPPGTSPGNNLVMTRGFFNAVRLDSSTPGLQLFINTNATSMNAGYNLANSFVPTAWNWFAVTWDGKLTTTGANFYVNGRLMTRTVNTNGSGTLVAIDTSALTIGTGSGGGAYGLENMIFWNRILTDSELRQMFEYPYDIYVDHSYRRMFISVVPQFQPSVFDSVTISENIKLNIDLSVSVNDSITVTDNTTSSIVVNFETAPEDNAEIVGTFIGGDERRCAQTFTLNADSTIGSVQVSLNNTNGIGSNFKIEIQTLSGGFPTGTLVNSNATVTIDSTSVPVGSYGWITATFPSSFVLASGTYAIVLTPTSVVGSVEYLDWGANGSGGYSGGQALLYRSGAWGSDAPLDLFFRVYSSSTPPIVVDLINEISVSDSITVSENLILLETDNINVFNSITVSENVTITNTTLPINVSDSITVSENLTVDLVYLVSVFDSITVSESLIVDLVYLININDTITLTELISRMVDENPNVNNTVTVSESLTIDLIDEPIVSDSITISENLTIDLVFLINISDSITLSESIVIDEIDLINANDSITLTENVSVSTINSISFSVNDTITVNESVTTTTDENVNINDSITLTESLTLNDIFCISVIDSITVTESKTIAQVYCPVVFDSITLSESITKMVDENINTSDSLIIMDVGVEYTVLTIGLAEAITISESKTVNNTQLGDMLVFDTINVSENLTVNNSILAGIFTDDSVGLTESFTVKNPLLFTSIYDTITPSESVAISYENFINTFENTSLSEFISAYTSIDLSAFDDITIEEFLNINYGTLLLVSIFDSISVSELISFFETINIYINDSISIQEYLTVIKVIAIYFLLKSKLVTSIDFNSKLTTFIELNSKLDITKKQISEMTNILKVESDINNKINLKSEMI